MAASDLELRAVVDRATQSLRGVKGDPSSFVPLHQLLERQHYRLAYWRAAADEINYRRFLDINELAGVRMEQAEVFETAHRLVLHLLAEGKIDGIRIDHIDGLFDPLQYCKRLHARVTDESGGNARPYLGIDDSFALRRRAFLQRRSAPSLGSTIAASGALQFSHFNRHPSLF